MEQKDNTKVYSILSYIFILWLVGLICDKDNETVMFHVNQGIWLTVAGVISGVIGIIPIVGGIIAAILGVACLVYMILGIVNVINGEKKYLPFFDKLPTLIK